MNSGFLAGRIDGKLLTGTNNKLTDYIVAFQKIPVLVY
jgi:hypothetical protein